MSDQPHFFFASRSRAGVCSRCGAGEGAVVHLLRPKRRRWRVHRLRLHARTSA